MDFTQTNPLPTVKIKNSIKIFTKTNVLIDQLIKHIQTIPNYQNLKNDIELIEYICQLVEQMIKKGNSDKTNKIDKKQLVLTVLQQLFALNPNEILSIANQIEYLVINGIIKKKALISKFCDCLKGQLPKLPK
jgi:hypothetical protein